MLNIDKLRYNYGKPFFDFVDQLVNCENIFYVNIRD